MRPGQEAPDEEYRESPSDELITASMRPGQEAPDEEQLDAQTTELAQLLQ